MLSKEASSTIFWVFGMTRPGIEPRSPGPLANTLRFPFCTCVCAFSMLFACVVFLFSEVGGLFWLDSFVCRYLVYLILYFYLFHYLLSGVFLVFQGQKIDPSFLLSCLCRQVFGLLSNKLRILTRSVSYLSYILFV